MAYIKNGYYYIKKPNHPNANKNGYIRMHRWIMSKQLGRALEKNEKVIHVNRNKQDNNPKNLKLITSVKEINEFRKSRNKGICYCDKPWTTKSYNKINGFNLKKIFKQLNEEVYDYRLEERMRRFESPPYTLPQVLTMIRLNPHKYHK